MTASCTPLPTLSWGNHNQSQAFELWKDSLESYFVINQVAEEDQFHYMLLSSGEKGHTIIKSWNLSKEEKEDPEFIFKKFETHMIGKPNKWVKRLELTEIQQRQDEPFQDFLCRVTNVASDCAFVSQPTSDEQVVFQIVKGCRSTELKKRLMAKGDKLTLKGATDISQAFEAAERSTTNFVRTTVDGILQPKRRDDQQQSRKPCRYCARSHPPRKCPAFGKKM